VLCPDCFLTGSLFVWIRIYLLLRIPSPPLLKCGRKKTSKIIYSQRNVDLLAYLTVLFEIVRFHYGTLAWMREDPDSDPYFKQILLIVLSVLLHMKLVLMRRMPNTVPTVPGTIWRYLLLFIQLKYFFLYCNDAHRIRELICFSPAQFRVQYVFIRVDDCFLEFVYSVLT
jgi:hypothetical protein